MAFGASVSGVSWTAMSASAFWFCPISSTHLLQTCLPTQSHRRRLFLIAKSRTPVRSLIKLLKAASCPFSFDTFVLKTQWAVASSLLFIILIFGSEIWEAGVASIVSDKYITTAPSLKSTVIFIIFGDSTSPYSVKFWDTTSTFKSAQYQTQPHEGRR